MRTAGNAAPTAAWRRRTGCELEIHRVDLAGSYTPDRWPRLLIAEMLPAAARTLAERSGEAVRIEVRSEGSVVAELGGTVWTGGAGTPIDVRGPDWAVLAWLVGRGASVAPALTATPPLRPWR